MQLFNEVLRHTFFVQRRDMFGYKKEFYLEFYDGVISCGFFKLAVNYFFEFPWNNCYHNAFMSVMNELFANLDISANLVEYIFVDIGFLDKLIDHCEDTFAFKHGTFIQKGALPFIFEIGYLLCQHSSNKVVKKILLESNFDNLDENFGLFYRTFIEPGKIQFLKGLRELSYNQDLNDFSMEEFQKVSGTVILLTLE